MSELLYRPRAHVDELDVGECTIHRAANDKGDRWWLLWFRVSRDDTGQPADFAVPVNPCGPFVENGPGGRTWGLTRLEHGAWQVSPSIDVQPDRSVHPGNGPAPSQWHQTPVLVHVPDGEPWANGALP